MNHFFSEHVRAIKNKKDHPECVLNISMTWLQKPGMSVHLGKGQGDMKLKLKVTEGTHKIPNN